MARSNGASKSCSTTHLRNANVVAVKVLHRELSIDAGLRARFLREGYAANSVGHPGTVRVLDDETAEDGSVFIVMDLLDGETLDARWERSGRRLGAREVVRLMADLLDVLAAAHAKGIVHRDLKPENLFLTRDGQLKVLDFGVARIREGSPTQTRTGSVFGTPAFMPPEQALGRTSEVDALSDLWAVGATAFTLLTGRFVHEGQTAEEMLVRSATQPAPELRTVATDVPPILARVIDRALAFPKADRWPNARAMREALLAAEESIRAGDYEVTDPGEEPEDEKTRLALPPEMTLRGDVSSRLPPKHQDVTLELPTLPAVSTVAGVESQAQRPASRHPRSRISAVAVAVGGSVIGFVVALTVVFSGRSDRAAPTAVEAAAIGTPRDSVPEVSTVAPSDAPSVRASPPLPVEELPIVPPAAAPTTTTSKVAASPSTTVAPMPRATPSPSVSSRPTPPAPVRKRDPLAP